ncbi:hypothetical protein HBB16_08010 [Pseudonocardia sp. MCCB 268]|nr:hypothetical protein [Pseudonocardia cytotoxica]
MGIAMLALVVVAVVEIRVDGTAGRGRGRCAVLGGASLGTGGAVRPADRCPAVVLGSCRFRCCRTSSRCGIQVVTALCGRCRRDVDRPMPLTPPTTAVAVPALPACAGQLASADAQEAACARPAVLHRPRGALRAGRRRDLPGGSPPPGTTARRACAGRPRPGRRSDPRRLSSPDLTTTCDPVPLEPVPGRRPVVADGKNEPATTTTPRASRELRDLRDHLGQAVVLVRPGRRGRRRRPAVLDWTRRVTATRAVRRRGVAVPAARLRSRRLSRSALTTLST